MPLETDWPDLSLSTLDTAAIWSQLLEQAAIFAQDQEGLALDRKMGEGDRLLADSAWDLWNEYPAAAPRTAEALKQWWTEAPGLGRAVLIVDALSLRELRPLLDAAAARKVTPSGVRATGAELPTTTDAFARALGVPSRSSLKANNPPGSFMLVGAYTDVIDIPFEDALSRIPAATDVFFWYTRIDDALHSEKNAGLVHDLARDTVASDGFWAIVNRLRQARRLVVTSDHGYADSLTFATENDEAAKDALRSTFRASRNTSDGAWTHRFMPPLVMESSGSYMVLGRRKWKVSGGFPSITHGGASLLEAAVPFIEFGPR